MACTLCNSENTCWNFNAWIIPSNARSGAFCMECYNKIMEKLPFDEIGLSVKKLIQFKKEVEKEVKKLEEAEKFFDINGINDFLEVVRFLKKENKEFKINYLCICDELLESGIMDSDDADLLIEMMEAKQYIGVIYPCYNCGYVTQRMEIERITGIEIV